MQIIEQRRKNLKKEWDRLYKEKQKLERQLDAITRQMNDLTVLEHEKEIRKRFPICYDILLKSGVTPEDNKYLYDTYHMINGKKYLNYAHLPKIVVDSIIAGTSCYFGFRYYFSECSRFILVCRDKRYDIGSGKIKISNATPTSIKNLELTGKIIDASKMQFLLNLSLSEQKISL